MEPRPAPLVPTLGRGNEHHALVPVEGTGAGVVVEFDLPGVRVGSAEYAEGPTGTTVLAFDRILRTAVDRRGGAIGMSGGFPWSHAIVLTGGSSFGLAAGTGVTDELLRRAGNSTAFDALPAVSTAVVYDFGVRDNAVYPDAELGRVALRHAVEGRVRCGRVGAGVSATVGKLVHDRAEFAGQGAAFAAVGEVKVLVVTVVNAIGVVVGRDGAVVRGNHDPATGRRAHPAQDHARLLSGAVTGHHGNTTITAVVTNVRLDDAALGQFARQVHGSMHRAIQPFHTGLDGDVLFAVTTDEIDLPGPDPALAAVGLGSVAGEVAWDAVLRAVE